MKIGRTMKKVYTANKKRSRTSRRNQDRLEDGKRGLDVEIVVGSVVVVSELPLYHLSRPGCPRQRPTRPTRG